MASDPNVSAAMQAFASKCQESMRARPTMLTFHNAAAKDALKQGKSLNDAMDGILLSYTDGTNNNSS